MMNDIVTIALVTFFSYALTSALSTAFYTYEIGSRTMTILKQEPGVTAELLAACKLPFVLRLSVILNAIRSFIVAPVTMIKGPLSILSCHTEKRYHEASTGLFLYFITHSEPLQFIKERWQEQGLLKKISIH